MKNIEMEFSYLGENKKIGLVKLSGDVDIATVPQFSIFMQKVEESTCPIILFDLQRVHYMNSTGFGIMASFAMEAKDQGTRKILFCNMQKNIINTYSLFGMDRVWPHFKTKEEALRSLETGEGLDPMEEEKVQFPVVRSCTYCRRPCNFPKPGHYKCPHCGTIHRMTEKGMLEQVAPPKKRIMDRADDCVDEIDITLPSDAMHLARIREFIFSFFSDQFEEQERSDMAMAVDEACGNVIEHAHKFDRNKKVFLHLEIHSKKILFTITDSGENTFNNIVQSDKINQEKLKNTGRGMGLYLIKQIMDEVHLKPTKTWGTALTMVKYLKENE